MYDPTDEPTDELFEAILKVLCTAPKNLAKRSLARLFEEGALAQVLLADAGAGPRDEEAFQEALALHWDRVEALRNELAASFLHSVQREEF